MTSAQVSRDPVASFLSQIAGVDVVRKRARTAQQMWSKETFAVIRDDFNAQFSTTGKDARRGRITDVTKYSMARWEALPESEKEVWRKRSGKDAEEVAKSKADSRRVVEKLSPEDTQRYDGSFLFYSLVPLTLLIGPLIR